MEQRIEDLKRFYGLLERLEGQVGGKRPFGQCHARMIWPRLGVYFFFEPHEVRSVSGEGMRVVRVGTHAVSYGSKASLWSRLKTHQGNPTGGNHRASIFRLHVGSALIQRDELCCSTWGQNVQRDLRQGEKPLEAQVSATLSQFSLLWLEIFDPSSPESLRAYIERHSIALLSAAWGLGMDPPSETWLGHHAAHLAVRQSGLWNVKHVEGPYDPAFLDVLAQLIQQQEVAGD